VREENSFRQTPGCTLPARPARCFPLALEHHSMTSLDVEVLLSRWTSRTRPESMTQTTSGIVTLVSAILVEIITRLGRREEVYLLVEGRCGRAVGLVQGLTLTAALPCWLKSFPLVSRRQRRMHWNNIKLLLSKYPASCKSLCERSNFSNTRKKDQNGPIRQIGIFRRNQTTIFVEFDEDYPKDVFD
jgi:hypothetical protein